VFLLFWKNQLIDPPTNCGWFLSLSPGQSTMASPVFLFILKKSIDQLAN